MVKNQFELTQLRESGRIAAVIVDELGKMIKPGVSAGDVELRAQELCLEFGVIPSFMGHEGYRWATCISVSDEVVHGIPYPQKIFREGDLVKVDFGCIYNGYRSDHCRTFAAGELSPIHQKLLLVGEQATMNAVKLAKAGNRVGDLSHAMESTAESNNFSVVEMYIGHGIGKKMHEPPEIPSFGEAGTGMVLQENMVICIECQVCEKGNQVSHDRDGWTARTKDGGYSVMFEQMVRVTKDGPEIFSAQ